MHPELLEQLKQLAATQNATVPFWLEDLVLHGPRYDQWNLPSGRPNRMELTEFLARWLKAKGVSQEQAIQWLLDYCFQVLAPFSKTGPSGIRHGTKANTRWVYNSELFFDFEALASQPPETQWESKPPYMHVFARFHELLPAEKQRAFQVRLRSIPVQVTLPVKERHREKYQQGLQLAREKVGAGQSLEKIVTALNEAGYPTRTGRRWTTGTLYRSLRGR